MELEEVDLWWQEEEEYNEYLISQAEQAQRSQEETEADERAQEEAYEMDRLVERLRRRQDALMDRAGRELYQASSDLNGAYKCFITILKIHGNLGPPLGEIDKLAREAYKLAQMADHASESPSDTNLERHAF